jgi:restriction endonuclease Mrr
VKGEDLMVGLSEWGVTSSMRAAEVRAKKALELYQEQLYMLASERLRELSPGGLSRLLSRLCVALGYERLEPLNASSDGGVALMAHHPTLGDTLVLAQRSRKPIGIEKVREVARSLSALLADRAMLISFSGFSEEAEGSQRKVQLLHERALIELMLTHKVGVGAYHLELPFIDEALLARCEAEG